MDGRKMDWANDVIVTKENEEINETVRKASKEKLKHDSRENSTNRKKMRLRSETDDNNKTPKKKAVEMETDPLILQRRQKQIDYGKNTVGYHNYMLHVPREQRVKGDPKTPDKYCKYSRRSWDMLIKLWRKKLHEYDTNREDASEEPNGHSDVEYEK